MDRIFGTHKLRGNGLREHGRGRCRAGVADRPRGSVAGEEEDLAWLYLGGLVEERDEGAGDGGGVGAVLGEGLGGDEDEG